VALREPPSTTRSRIISRLITTPIKQVFRFFASLKTAIPLLVITIVVTIGGSLLPTPDAFRSWWYLSLLGLNGISLLSITIQHIPMILERKGRNALIGVMATHLGILILIAGVIYAGMSGFRYEVRAIEREMTIVPGLPFVIRLDELVVEDYSADEVANLAPEFVPKKRQDSYLTLYKKGDAWFEAIAAPGRPAKVDGITILPALTDIGWYFELIATDVLNRQKTIPVKPWSPTVVNVGKTQVMIHSLMDAGETAAQVFTMIEGQPELLGLVSREQGLVIEGQTISLGEVKRYTGLEIYNRPHAPILAIGCLAMLFGLVWHFYHRHRDRRSKTDWNPRLDLE
jgi:hypothetical protein